MKAEDHIDRTTVAAECIFKGDPLVKWRGRWYRAETAPWLGAVAVSIVETRYREAGIVVLTPDFPQMPDIDWSVHDPFYSEPPSLAAIRLVLST